MYECTHHVLRFMLLYVIRVSADNSRHNTTQDMNKPLNVFCGLFQCLNVLSRLCKVATSVRDALSSQFPELESKTHEEPLVTWIEQFSDFVALNQNEPYFPSSFQFVQNVVQGRHRSLGLYLLRRLKLNSSFCDEYGFQQLAGTTTPQAFEWLRYLTCKTSLFGSCYSLGLSEKLKCRVFASTGADLEQPFIAVHPEFLCVVQQLLFLWSAFCEKCFSLFKTGGTVNELPELILKKQPSGHLIFATIRSDFCVRVGAESTTFVAKDKFSIRVRIYIYI